MRIRALAFPSSRRPSENLNPAALTPSSACSGGDTMGLLTLPNKSVSCHSVWAPGNRERPSRGGPSPAPTGSGSDPCMWVRCAEMPLALWNVLFDVAHLCRARRGGNPGQYLVHSLVCWGCGLERGRQGRCFMQPTFCPKGGSPHLCGFLAQAKGFGQIETTHLPRGPRRCQLLPGSPPRCL